MDPKLKLVLHTFSRGERERVEGIVKTLYSTVIKLWLGVIRC